MGVRTQENPAYVQSGDPNTTLNVIFCMMLVGLQIAILPDLA